MSQPDPPNGAANFPTVRIEVGGLNISVENAPDVDIAARTALGLLGKIEASGIGHRARIGFHTTGNQVEMRPQPDFTWTALGRGEEDAQE